MSSKRYWLRGGIISLCISVVLYAILVMVSYSAHDISDAYGLIIENILNFIANLLLVAQLSREGFSTIESFVGMIIYTFFMGALVGWIYGRLKKSPVQ